MRPVENERHHVGRLAQIEAGKARLAALRLDHRGIFHPIRIRNELSGGVYALVEPQILKLGPQARQARGLLGLRSELAEIQEGA
jgi:hypothetical protein